MGCQQCLLGRASVPLPCRFRATERAAGSLLVPQHEVPQQVCYVKQGTVMMSSLTEEGEERWCALRGSGSLIGLEALRSQPTDYEAWALTDVVVCQLGTSALRQWTGALDTPMGALLCFALDECAGRGGDRLALSGRAVERVARFLSARHARPGGDQPLAIDHAVLARMLGMRAETLSRVLARLRAAGALHPGRLVRVRDALKLESLAAPLSRSESGCQEE